MGLARMTFTLGAVDARLHMRLQRLRFLGVPCPAWLRPRIVAEETGEGERLHFRIEACVPGIGRVVGYRGHLVVPLQSPCDAPAWRGSRGESARAGRARHDNRPHRPARATCLNVFLRRPVRSRRLRRAA